MKKDHEKIIHNIIIVFIILFTLLLAFSVWKLVEISLSYAESSKEYEELRQFITVDDSDSGNWLPDRGKYDSNSADNASGDHSASEETSDQESSKDAENVQDGELLCPITVDFETLWKINPDIKGWIYLEETGINYPIVQGENNDEYLYTSVKGTANKGGSIFLDALNAGDFSDPHTIIYGHNMKNGSMFGSLKKLNNQERIDEMEESLVFWIITPEKINCYDVISIRTVDVTGDTYTLFSGPGNMVSEYINKRARLSAVKLDHRTYTEEDKMVTLSTCTGNDQYRLVVHGVLRTS